MYHPSWRSLWESRWVPRITSVIILLVGCLVFFGWLTDNLAIQTIFPNLSAPTALMFVFISLAVLLLISRKGLLVPRVLAGLTILISVLRLAEAIFGIDTGVNHLFVISSLANQPKLLAPNTALAFILMAFALLPDQITSQRRIIIGQTCALLVILIASMAVAGHLFDLASLYAIRTYPPMSLSTACLLFVLSLGVLTSKPDRGLTALFVSPTLGGAMIRRFLPVAIFALLVLSGLQVLIGSTGVYVDESDVIVFAALTIMVIVSIIWWNARMIDQTDRERKQSEDALRTSEARYRVLFEQSSDGIIVVDQKQGYIDANPQAERLTGYSREELLRLKLGALSPARDDDKRALRFAALEKEGFWSEEASLLRKDGSEIVVELAYIAIAPGVSQSVFRDISARKQSEDALRASEARYRTLFEYSSDAILIIDEQGHYVDANPQAERLTGYSHDEILHLKVGAMTPPQQVDLAPKRLEAARNAGGWSGEGILLRKDGSERIVEIAGVHVAPGLYQTIVHDINERKQAEEALRASEARYRALFENSSDAILIFDEQGRYLEANPQTEQLTGYSHDEILMKRVGQFAAQPTDGQTAFSEIKRSGQLQTDYTLARKDGSLVAVEFSATIIAPGLYQSILHNISARKKVEDNLRKSLEQERELNELKSRFVSMVSHDFRTPLAVIQSSTDLLLNYADQMDKAKRQDRLEKIQLQIGRLVQMLDNILIIGKAERVGLEFHAEHQNVGEFCAALVAELQLATPAHSIVFNSSGDCADVVFDPKLLHQAFTNLVSNAVKYSPIDQPVVVDLACGEAEIVMQVQDHGIGIPEEDQKHLFELFHRAQNVGNISGTGLGLSIVKQAVEAHGGTISVESHENVGTTFTICLPRSQSA